MESKREQHIVISLPNQQVSCMAIKNSTKTTAGSLIVKYPVVFSGHYYSRSPMDCGIIRLTFFG